ncbi:ferredoxin [Micromonospora sp. NPDC000442]|uniref:ferredoxin n=1 Tax=Micromonospora sp. NPDC000442 TaxID=3364217 RepID=UPI003690F40A
MSTAWRIQVDAERCIGSGSCVGMAPAHFRMESGVATPVSAAVEPTEAAIDAAESCPVEAIAVRDDDGTVIAPT